MRRLIGAYGVWESLISLSIGVLLILFDVVYFYEALNEGIISDRAIFSGVFINFVFLFILATPYLSKKAEGISNDTVKAFLDIPDKEQPFRFSAFSTFLGDQSLGSFFGTLLILTGKAALLSYGPIISGGYVALLFIASVMLMAISFLRFIAYFTRYHVVFYMIAASLSAAIMLSFFQLGIKMAG